MSIKGGPTIPATMLVFAQLKSYVATLGGACYASNVMKFN